MTIETLPPRIQSKITVDANGCWIFTGSRVRGSGYLWWAGRKRYAHRVVYELLRGAIPAGLVLDHFRLNPGERSAPCSRACCNPDHVEPVTSGINTVRGDTISGRRSRQTHCTNGHPLTGANVYIRKDNGGRQCQACHRERERRR